MCDAVGLDRTFLPHSPHSPHIRLSTLCNNSAVSPAPWHASEFSHLRALLPLPRTALEADRRRKLPMMTTSRKASEQPGTPSHRIKKCTDCQHRQMLALSSLLKKSRVEDKETQQLCAEVAGDQRALRDLLQQGLRHAYVFSSLPPD